ncbi:hypothetical protein An04g02590 [Aspergillus niger]|uniref:Uncharacterized protein n=2 Tax=Aspergillus niger TaxID=5061 RepID=A2QI81_ASPNC|nr:hypothetical protein An04g02590 [Aspergillus niger]CAL00746.1 hypothetical protein An04g02590 [Aspergillus niger]
MQVMLALPSASVDVQCKQISFEAILQNEDVSDHAIVHLQLASIAQKAKAIAKGKACDLRKRARNKSGGPAREGGENLTEGTGRSPEDGTERQHGVGWRIDGNSIAAENLRENGGSRGNLDSRQLNWHLSSSNVRNPFGANAGRSYCTAEIRCPTNHVRLRLFRSIYYKLQPDDD